MRIAEARELISQWVSGCVRICFEEDFRHMPSALRRPGRNPGYDSSRVPEVPPALVRTDQVKEERRPGVIFTWKVHSGEPPYFMMQVRTTWLSRVVNRGWLFIGGQLVLDVREWDEQERPLRVLSAAISGWYDHRLEGWRANGLPTEYRVDWSDPEKPKCVDGKLAVR